MLNYKTVPPKQRYITLGEIHKSLGSRGVVAYSCKVADSVPEGGFVIAALNETDSDDAAIKAFQRRLAQTNPDYAPIFYLRVEAQGSIKRSLVLTYNANGYGKDETAVIPQ